jgi:phosphoglycerate dehydrogenase-like enzyme
MKHAPLRSVSFGLAVALACACKAAPRSEPTVTEPAAVETRSLGSERGSRIAVDTQGGAREVVFLAGAISEDERERLHSLAPNVRLIAGLSREDALKRAADADGCDARFLSSEFLAAATKLRWVQAMSAGVDRYLGVTELRARPEIVFCNMRGVHGPAIADHVFGLILALSRDLPNTWRAQSEGRWNREGGERESFALAGRTLCVVGLGGIGTEVARRAKGFEMRVVATRRSGTDAPAFVDRVELADELFDLLPESDVVVLCVPLTPETEHLFDARAFAVMKPGAILINIARGKVCDTAALIDALKSKRLFGAGLDVTDPEPLPADHELWKLDNVLITPHVAAQAALTDERADALFAENLRRFAKGEPLLNVVDWSVGY